MAAETEDLIVTAPELAEWLGLTDRSVRELAAEGRIPKAGRGCYPLRGSVRQYCAHVREVAAGRKPEDPDGPDLVAERARLAKAQADFQEMENDLLRGEVVLVADAVRVVGEQFAVVRSNLLAVPSGAALALSRCRTPAEIQAQLFDHISEALEALCAEPIGALGVAPPATPKLRGKRRK